MVFYFITQSYITQVIKQLSNYESLKQHYTLWNYESMMIQILKDKQYQRAKFYDSIQLVREILDCWYY